MVARRQQVCPQLADLLNQRFTVTKRPALAPANGSQPRRHPGAWDGARSPPRSYVSVWPWRSFCSLLFLAGTSPSLRGGAEDARNSQPPAPQFLASPAGRPARCSLFTWSLRQPGCFGVWSLGLLGSPQVESCRDPGWFACLRSARGTRGSGVWKLPLLLPFLLLTSTGPSELALGPARLLFCAE